MSRAAIFSQLLAAAFALAGFPVLAFPLSLKISNSKGEAWSYSRGENGQWLLEHRQPSAPLVRRPLAKLQHDRIFEDLRRSVVRHPAKIGTRSCPGVSAQIELGGYGKSQTRDLCLGRLSDKDLYGRLLARLDEAQGKKGSGRRLFSR